MATPILAGSIAASAQSSLMQSRENQMLQQIQSGAGRQDDGRIEKGAKEFESMLLSSWLQQAEQSMATVPGAEDEEDSTGRDQMMSLGVQSLSTAMVASGGIGIASMIAKALHARAEKADSGPGTPASPEKP
jgi:Rod binding domain-containing protein